MTLNDWLKEAECIDVFDHRSGEVARAAEYPPELDEARDAALEDRKTFLAASHEWAEFVREATKPRALMYLGIEQSCSEGILLPWDMRAVRLWTAPPVLLAKLHAYWRLCPWYVADLQAHFIYWLVRAERARRLGAPHWSPATEGDR